MRVDSGKLVPRRVAVAHKNAQRTWTERSSVILELESGDLTGFGEAAPLPGYSHDDLAAATAELAGCWERLPELDVDANVRDTFRASLERSGVRSPAAVFALETALLDLVAKARGRPAWAVLRGDDDARPVQLSALAQGETPEQLAESAERAHARGLRVVKIKVGGPGAALSDPRRLDAIRTRLGDSVALRLDANQSLSPEDVAGTLQTLSAFDPELLEEPTKAEHLAGIRESPIRLALDESLMREDWPELVRAAALRGTHAALVLKPMALGGFERCLAAAEIAGQLGLDIIVTHLFDGPIGTVAAACLALAVRAPVRPCGLDCHGRFDDRERPVSITATEIVPWAVAGLGPLGFG